MTFRRLAEGGLFLAAAAMHSRTRRYLRSSIITAAEYHSKNRNARGLFFFLKKAEMNGGGPNNAQHLHRWVPVVAAIATTTSWREIKLLNKNEAARLSG